MPNESTETEVAEKRKKEKKKKRKNKKERTRTSRATDQAALLNYHLLLHQVVSMWPKLTNSFSKHFSWVNKVYKARWGSDCVIRDLI